MGTFVNLAKPCCYLLQILPVRQQPAGGEDDGAQVEYCCLACWKFTQQQVPAQNERPTDRYSS